IVPKVIAITRSRCSRKPWASCISSRPPSSTIPWIAFVPDISGVCSVFGTFEITSKPTNAARTRIAISVTVVKEPPRDQGSGDAGRGFGALVDDLPRAGDARPGDHLIFEIELELALV